MTVAGGLISIVFLLLGILESVLCAIWSKSYFRSGPILFREEWKSSASSKEATATVLAALSETGMAFQEGVNEIFARPENVVLGITPRLRFVLNDEKEGAMLAQETRPYFGTVSFTLAFLGLLAATGFAGSAIILLILLLPFSWVLSRASLNQVRRLHGLKKTLALIGVQACAHCGYDLHGVPGHHPCPECGHSFAGLRRTATPDQIRHCLQESAATHRLQGLSFCIAGFAALIFSATCAAGVIWFVSFQLGGRSLDFAMLFVWAIVVLGIWGGLAERSRRRLGLEDEPVRMPDRDLPYSYRRIASIGALGRLGGQVLFMGPRLIMEGVEMLGGYSKRTASIDRAVRMIGLLMKKTTSLGIVDLKEQEESPADTRRIAQWLRRKGWVGITEHEDRVFLYTESRERLDPRDT